jgi:hypothetical protein
MRTLFGQIAVALLGGARQRAQSWPLILLAVVFALVSFVFLAGAAFFALLPSLGPAASAALVAIALLLLAAIVMLAALLVRRRRPAAPDPALLATLLQQLGAGAVQSGRLPNLAVLAIILGIAVSYSPTLRGLLRSLTEEAND